MRTCGISRRKMLLAWMSITSAAPQRWRIAAVGDALRQQPLACSGEVAVEIGVEDRDEALQRVEPERVHRRIQLDASAHGAGMLRHRAAPAGGQPMTDVEALDLVAVDTGDDRDARLPPAVEHTAPQPAASLDRAAAASGSSRALSSPGLLRRGRSLLIAGEAQPHLGSLAVAIALEAAALWRRVQVVPPDGHGDVLIVDDEA